MSLNNIIPPQPTKITNNNIRKYLKMNQTSLNHIKNSNNTNNINNHQKKKT
jgi:hypothetical protein